MQPKPGKDGKHSGTESEKVRISRLVKRPGRSWGDTCPCTWLWLRALRGDVRVKGLGSISHHAPSVLTVRRTGSRAAWLQRAKQHQGSRLTASVPVPLHKRAPFTHFQNPSPKVRNPNSNFHPDRSHEHWCPWVSFWTVCNLSAFSGFVPLPWSFPARWHST